MSADERNAKQYGDKRARALFVLSLAGAAVLRMVWLGSLPPALFRDEAEKGYTAFCILRTGHDLFGHYLPLFINAFGVTTSAVYQYAAIPFIAAFGLNEWSVRLPAVAAGLLTIAINWAWVMRQRGRSVALWTTFFLALSPWHIVFSRWAQQGIFLPFFLSVAFYFWQSYLEGRRHALAGCAAAYALAIYTYDVARLFVPLLILIKIVLYRRELKSRLQESMAALVTLLVCLSPVIWLMVTNPGAAQARFRFVSIAQPGMSPLSVASAFLHNYSLHFSPAFLVFHGDQELRHSPGTGMLTLMEFVAFAAGIVYILRNRTRQNLMWLAAILLFPVAASLTRVGIPHALRGIVAVPVIQNIAGLGMDALDQRLRRVLPARASSILLLLSVVTFCPFAWMYYSTYRNRSAVSWQYGVKQALSLLQPELPKIDKVVFYNVTGAESLVAFYAKIPPETIRGLTFEKTKYSFPPFNYPLEELYRRITGPAAYVMLPLYDPPPKARAIPIYAPGGKQMAMIVYLNEALSKELVQRGK